MSKVLRIDLQTDDMSVFKDEEDLRKALIDLHYQDYKESYSKSLGYSEKDRNKKMEKFKQITLNQLCCEFDWDYEIITDEQAKEYDKKSFPYPSLVE